jgi:hypothetical protein
MPADKVEESPTPGDSDQAGTSQAGQPERRRHTLDVGATTPRGGIVQHLVAFSGALIIIAVVTKSLRVSHMDLTSAQLLLVNENVTSVVTGILLLFFPALISIALLGASLLLAVSFFVKAGSIPLSREILLGATVVLMAIAIIAVPAGSLLRFLLGGVVGLVLGFGSSWVRRRFRRGSGERTSHRAPSIVGRRISSSIFALVAFVPILTVLFNDVAWLPPDRLQVVRQEAVTAYEISRNDERVLFLFDETRQVEAVKPDQIVSQQPCRLTGLLNSRASLWSLVTDETPPRTPPCP